MLYMYICIFKYTDYRSVNIQKALNIEISTFELIAINTI